MRKKVCNIRLVHDEGRFLIPTGVKLRPISNTHIQGYINGYIYCMIQLETQESQYYISNEIVWYEMSRNELDILYFPWANPKLHLHFYNLHKTAQLEHLINQFARL